MNKVQRLACLLAVTIAGVAVAEDHAPTTQPQTPELSVRSDSAGPTSRPWHLRRSLEPVSTDMPTEEEWHSVVEFMGQYSPNRLKAIEQQGTSDAPRYATLRKAVWGHYRDLTQLKDHGDQELYDLKVNLVQADDEVWALQRQLHEAPDSDRPVLRYQLKQKITAMMKLGLKERAIRIARLEKSLADEKAKLAADQLTVDQRADERLRAFARSNQQSRQERRRGSSTTSADAVGSEVK
ncbi:MAG TPA: hypothetical protein VFE58_04745 [Tepidisphaeraceae bacterium]|jgi:hypothetical protein|nr:hypothetical protein [Tepidisphaeraceae bacterium]